MSSKKKVKAKKRADEAADRAMRRMIRQNLAAELAENVTALEEGRLTGLQRAQRLSAWGLLLLLVVGVVMMVLGAFGVL